MAGEGGGSTTHLGDGSGTPCDVPAPGLMESPGNASGTDRTDDPYSEQEPIGEVTEVAPTEVRKAPVEPAPMNPEPIPTAPKDLLRPLHRNSIAYRLYEESYAFDFFQAVRLLQRMEPGRVRVGRAGPPSAEAVRFRARISLSFPPSSIYDLKQPTSSLPVPVLVQAFMGLTGPNGVLPRHYTELLYRIEREVRTPEKHALRDWFDLFNHRLVSLFYRAWEKYRFYVPFERGEYDGPEPDPFTNALFCLIGLGARPLRRRLEVVARDSVDEYGETQKRVLARIEDLALLHFSGALAHRPRCAVALEAIIQDYFQIKSRIDQFQGQWLPLEPSNRTRFEGELGNNQLGVTTVAGDRVWDRQSKFRVRLGPLTYEQFTEFLPDREPVAARKTFLLLVHLVRLYAEPTLDFDVQLILKAEEVPKCRLTGDGTFGARLGWNTWLLTQNAMIDAEDVVLEGEEGFVLEGSHVNSRQPS